MRNSSLFLLLATTVSMMYANTLGQQVASLVTGEVEAGYREVTFDASGLSSGIYVYRLTAGGFVRTREMVVVK